MAVNFSGITSGLDTKAIIDATLAAQRIPVTRLEGRKSDWQAQISSLGKLASKLDELKTMAKDLQEIGNVLAVKGTVSDEDFATATFDGAATAGHYEIGITRLARAEKDRSVAYNSNLSQVKAGTLTITTAGDDAVDVEIEEGDSLQDVVDKINASDARVDASIIRDGSKSYLQIVAADSGHEIGGAANDAITISEVYGGSGGTELGLTQVVQAQNAKLTVDGLPVEHRKNHITDVLDGVTLDLKKEGNITLDVAADETGTKEKLQGFVKLVNEVLDLVKGETRSSDGARKAGADPAVERLSSELRNLVGGAVGGLTGKYSIAAGIGIETTSAGRFELDSDVFEAAFAQDAHAISRLFAQASTGIGARLQTAIERYTDVTDGIITNRKESIGLRVNDADRQISRLEERLTRMQKSMQLQFTRMEQALAQIQQQGSALSGLTDF